MKRKIIKIDEKKCTGCGLCVPDCAEGALQVIDGKARLISDLFCDGLGACLGSCPEGAIKVEEREAEPYNERAVMERNIVPAGENTIKAHLVHLKGHGAFDYLQEAIEYLNEKRIKNPQPPDADVQSSSGQSQLGHWPIQLHLLSPYAPFLKNADLVILADCTAYAYANTCQEFIKGKVVAIGCPKLDDVDAYIEKLTSIMKVAKPKNIQIVRMEVPCCGGIVEIVKQAMNGRMGSGFTSSQNNDIIN